MSKRFMLSAAGVTAAAIGSSASAAVVQFHYDVYAGEAGWTVTDSASNIVASLSSVNAGANFGALSSGLYYWSGSTGSFGYAGLYNLDLANGDYTITMTDSYGDGWSDMAWGYNTSGVSAFVYGSTAIDFTSGNQASGTFTVVPAPGALALLGLAGLAGTRRRRA